MLLNLRLFAGTLLLLLSGCQSSQPKQTAVSGPITAFLRQVKQANTGRSVHKHVAQQGGWQEEKFIENALAAHELALLDKADLSTTALAANYSHQLRSAWKPKPCALSVTARTA